MVRLGVKSRVYLLLDYRYAFSDFGHYSSIIHKFQQDGLALYA